MDLSAVLEPVPGPTPCGPNLKGTLEWGELERLARGKPAEYVGKILAAPAEDPPWREVRTRTVALLSKSKDLRVAVQLTRASLHASGWAGLASGLGVARQLLERYWDDVHPTLNPADDHDPTLRLNCLAELADDPTLATLRSLPVVTAPRAGRFSLREIVQARTVDTSKPVAGQAKPTGPTSALVAAAFLEADLTVLAATAAEVHQALEHLTAIDTFVSGKIGTRYSLNVGRLKSLLAEIDRLLAEQVAARKPSPESVGGEVMAETNGNGSSAAAVASATLSAPTVVYPGAVRTREDVVKALQSICDYYRVHEPSSPIPLLLTRAQRLVAKDFMEILQDLAPAGVTQAQAIRGAGEPSKT